MNFLSFVVNKFAQSVVQPKVAEMDEKERLDKDILKGLFEQGLMAVEVPTKYGGSGCSFTSIIVAVEELAKVDPAVSVICDVQVNNNRNNECLFSLALKN